MSWDNCMCGSCHYCEFACGTVCYVRVNKRHEKEQQQQTIRWIWISFKFQLLPISMFIFICHIYASHQCYWFLFRSIKTKTNFWSMFLTQINKSQNWWRVPTKVIDFFRTKKKWKQRQFDNLWRPKWIYKLIALDSFCIQNIIRL